MKVKYGTENDQIQAISEFHEKFVTIHPFLDGNGRVARAISALQYQDLLEKDVHFDKISRESYYQALQNALN